MRQAPHIPPLAFSDHAAATAQMFRVANDLRAIYLDHKRALSRLDRAYQESLLRLNTAVELRDGDTGVHVVRIGFLCSLLAEALGQEPRYVTLLRIAAPLHDVGKIGIPDSILKKESGLSPEEWSVMRRHPEIGAQILGNSDIPLFRMAAEVALTHHEKFNGSGYPYGLAGEQIPLSGRICALVDFFDALTMDRCYRKALPDELALDMIANSRGSHFDPQLVDTFLAISDHLIATRNTINQRQLTFEDLLDDPWQHLAQVNPSNAGHALAN